MKLGFEKNEIMSMLDNHLQDVSKDFEDQITKMRKDGADPELSLATLLASSMLSMLDAVSSIIEMNNKKITEDLAAKGVISSEG